MATFRTDQEARKWETLSKSISKPLSKMGAGTATSDDLKSIADVLNKYDALAADLFARSIESAEMVTHDFIDKLNADRIASGKRALTLKAVDRLYEQNLKKVLQASTEDILGTLKDHFTQTIKDAVADISDGVKDHMQSAFQKVRSLIKNGVGSRDPNTPAGLPPSNSQKAALGLHGGAGAPPSTTLSNGTTAIAKGTPETTSSKGKKTKRTNATPQSHPPSAPDSASVVAPSSSTMNTWSKIANFVLRRDRTSSTSLADDSRRANTWLGKVQTFFTSKTDWIVKKYQKIAKKGSRFMGKMEDYAKAFAVTMMAPALLKGIADTVRKELDFDSIEKFISNAWSSLQTNAGEAVDWVIKKVKSWFGVGEDGNKKATPGTTARASATNNAATGINTAAGGAVEKARSLVGAGVSNLADPKLGAQAGSAINEFNASVPPPDLAREHKKLNMMTGILNDAKAKAAKAQSLGQPVSPAIQNTIVDMTKQIDTVKANIKAKTDQWQASKAQASAKSATTSPTALASNTSLAASAGIAPTSATAASSMMAPLGSTQTTVESSVQPQPSKGLVIEKDANKGAEAQNKVGRAPNVTSSISLGSFGMNAGDSALFMLNLGIA